MTDNIFEDGRRVANFTEFSRLYEAAAEMKFVEANVEDGGVEVVVDEIEVVGKRFFGLLKKKKTNRVTYRKSKGYEWYNVDTGKAVWDTAKRKQLNKWSETARAEQKRIEEEQKRKEKEKDREKDKKKTGRGEDI